MIQDIRRVIFLRQLLYVFFMGLLELIDENLQDVLIIQYHVQFFI